MRGIGNHLQRRDEMSKCGLKIMVSGYVRGRGITMDALAREMGISPATLSRKLSGERALSFEDAHGFAQLLGISLDELYAIRPLTDE